MPPKSDLKEKIAALLKVRPAAGDLERLNELYSRIGLFELKNKDIDYIEDLWKRNLSTECAVDAGLLLASYDGLAQSAHFDDLCTKNCSTFNGQMTNIDLSQASCPNSARLCTSSVSTELAEDGSSLKGTAQTNRLVQELERQVAISDATARAIEAELMQAKKTIALLENSEEAAVKQRDRLQAKALELEAKLTIGTAAEAELERAKQTITRLQIAGKRVVAERDKWETQARELEGQLAKMRFRCIEHDNQKFAQAKRIFAKLYHPNALVRQSQLEATIRGEVFKEFWVELERVEREH